MLEIWLINDLIIWAVYASMTEGMIFENIDRGIRAYLYQRVKPPILRTEKDMDNVYLIVDEDLHHYRRWKKATDTVDYWLKPLYKCPICQPSVWGSAGFLIFVDQPLYFWPIYVISMVGANYIISQAISKHITIDSE